MIAGTQNRAPWEWAFFTSLAALSGLLGLFLPILSFFVAVFLPLPFILLLVRLDLRYGLLGLFTAGLLTALVAPKPLAVLLLYAHYGILGLLYGLLFKNHVSSGANLAAGLLGAGFLALLAAGLYYALSGANPFGFDPETRQVAEQMLAASQDAGALEDLSPEWQEDFSGKIVSIIELFIPSVMVMNSVLTSAVTFFLARLALLRLNFSLPAAPVFTRMSLPWYSIWGLIAGLGLTLAGDHFGLTLAARIGKNLLFLLFYVHLALGLSVAAYYYRKVNLARPVKIIIVLIAAVYFPFSIGLLLVLGVTDPLINLRRLPAARE